MAEPVKIRKPSYEESDLRDLSKQIQKPTLDFIETIRRIQDKPSLIDDSIQLGHFAKSILELEEASKIAKGLV